VYEGSSIKLLNHLIVATAVTFISTEHIHTASKVHFNFFFLLWFLLYFRFGFFSTAAACR
jgi:hypothetical protein